MGNAKVHFQSPNHKRPDTVSLCPIIPPYFNMSTEREFLEIIRADLDNPVPRLIFADWLDEQGDPRGEFIRTQCELEQAELSALQQRWLRQRERELLEDHEADWLLPIAKPQAENGVLGVSAGICGRGEPRCPRVHRMRGFFA